MEQETTIAENLPAITETPGSSLPSEIIAGDITQSVAVLEHIQRVGKMFAASKLVPEHYRNNLPDCCIALLLARDLRVNPFLFMQHSFVVYGRPGIEGKFAIALINASGRYRGGLRFRYSGDGDSRSCIAHGARTDTGEMDECEVTVKMAKENGWWTKKDSKWPLMTDQMLAYRAGAWLARRYCPEVLMGLQTIEEIHDIGGVEVVGTPPHGRALLNRVREGESASVAQYFADKKFIAEQTRIASEADDAA